MKKIFDKDLNLRIIKKIQNLNMQKLNSKNLEKPLEKYFAEIILLPDQTFKVVLAKKLTKVNQFKRTWIRMDARNLARQLNNGSILIK